MSDTPLFEQDAQPMEQAKIAGPEVGNQVYQAVDEKAVVAKNAPTELTVTDSLLQMAISKDLDISKLEKLIELKNKEEERQCKKDFDFHFSEMQKAYKPATKSGEVYNQAGDKLLYKFSSLEDILKVYAPIIAEHGFSFRWKEEMNGDNKKVITCIVSGYGHEESSSVEIPIAAGNNFTNAIQQRGVSTSYGKRYSFINAFGVIIEGEDNDAALTFSDGVQYADEVMAIENCENAEQLKAVWKEIWNKLEQDGRKIMFTVYEKKKKELMK